ncbi:cyclic peptide export ABC transporter [Tahibacter soli]|uniref:Cyclic peptide export ABC transporter n=1 Tax=Tahibacter soli TaxID=2983605 RepID=A0A9X3YPK9_9GAMM|nr:cyclic peptide export ABC transporter [Tahibacter soli]MDC8016146.1 cyclic peptide export ABC transporter [Tahibacter soli]
MRLILLLMRKSALLLLLSIFAGVAAGAAGSAVLALVNEALRTIDKPDPRIGWIFLALAGTAMVCKLAAKLMLVRASTRTVRDMRLTLCRQILEAPLRNVEKKGSGGLMGALTEDVHRVAEALIALPEQCANATIALACFGYLFWLSWPLALVYVGIFAVGIVVYKLVARHAKPSMNAARQTWDQLIEHYTGLVNGNKELKLHRRRRDAFTRIELEPTANAMMNHSWRWNWILAVANAHTQMIFFALLGMALFIAPNFAAIDKHVLSGFILMSLYMGGPISSLVGAIPQFNLAEVSLKKLKSLGLSLAEAARRDVKPYDADVETRRPAFRDLELRALEYAYDDAGGSTFRLGPVDLKLRAGELTYVIGGNGSGKSSFARVVTGLYPQDAGALLFNGVEIDDANRDDYRQNFSVIFSDYHLFRTLYGMTSAEFVTHAGRILGQLGLSEKVGVEDGKLSTVDLSAGQRKRLALLTAFLENREIYLFDEWAADQDPSFKRVFYHEIVPQLKARGKTVIVISHDNHYFELADRIVRFEDGKVVEDRYVNSPSSVRLPAEAAEPVAV